MFGRGPPPLSRLSPLIIKALAGRKGQERALTSLPPPGLEGLLAGQGTLKQPQQIQNLHNRRVSNVSFSPEGGWPPQNLQNVAARLLCGAIRIWPVVHLQVSLLSH